MSDLPVLYEARRAIATFTLNRPDVLNAQHDALIGEPLRKRCHPAVLAMRSMPKPVICGFKGPAPSAGTSIALAGRTGGLAEVAAAFLQRRAPVFRER